MTQGERRLYLIKRLLAENPKYSHITIPSDQQEQKDLLRSLLNVRSPQRADDDFLQIQNDYLTAEISAKGITDLKDLTPLEKGIYLWQGDITTLKCDGIVNAANSGLTGCYYPLHKCIDNCIHTYGGVQMRLKCANIIAKQGHAEETGQAKITPAYNLPAKYVLHTVGPIIYNRVTPNDEKLLSSCYRKCLELSEEYGLKSLAFCCISTGEFHFPNERAAKIAIETVKGYQAETNSDIEVIFNVFKELDYEIYKKILSSN